MRYVNLLSFIFVEVTNCAYTDMKKGRRNQREDQSVSHVSIGHWLLIKVRFVLNNITKLYNNERPWPYDLVFYILDEQRQID